MIRAYIKVLDVIDKPDTLLVRLETVKSGYSHIKNDEDLEKLDIFDEQKEFYIEVDKRLRRQFEIGRVSMVDWFKNCPKGWER